MSWESTFLSYLDRVVDREYLRSGENAIFGAGRPVDALDVLQASIGEEDMEHYPDLLTDSWSVYHLVDRSFGLDDLLTFEFSESGERIRTATQLRQ